MALGEDFDLRDGNLHEFELELCEAFSKEIVGVSIMLTLRNMECMERVSD
jgi:hypothetical protein